LPTIALRSAAPRCVLPNYGGLLAILGRSKEKCPAAQGLADRGFGSQSPLSVARRTLGRSLAWPPRSQDIAASPSATRVTRIEYRWLSRRSASGVCPYGCALRAK